MEKINIAATNAALSSFSTAYEDVGKLMSEINDNYFNGIDDYWNTNTAFKYFSEMAGSLNTTIGTMNKAFRQACTCIKNAANNIANAEGGARVGTVSINDISDISLEWEGVDDGYKLPLDGETTDLTSDIFTANMKQIKENCETCKSAMIDIKTNGLGNKISGAAIEGITNMIKKVQDVMDEYNSNAVSSASNEDANSKGYEINTGD